MIAIKDMSVRFKRYPALYLPFAACAVIFSYFAIAGAGDDSDNQGQENRAVISGECSPDAFPASDRRDMENEYLHRVRADGKESADAWIVDQGRRFRQRLVAEGICQQPNEDTVQIAANAQAPINTGRHAPGCTFDSLSEDDKSRYLSRYKRRIRVDGQAYADRWLYEQVCMTAEQRRALQPGSEGENCRVVSTPVTSLDGSMTVGMRQECD